MAKLEVFDPPMCCSSGVCGPKVDPALPRFAADLEWMRSQGVAVSRYNLAQQPMAFAQNNTVKTAMSEDEACLPLVLVDGKIVSRGAYPSRGDLAAYVCIAMRARNEAPGEKARELEELGERHIKGGTFAGTSSPCGCCGPRTDRKKSSNCCG